MKKIITGAFSLMLIIAGTVQVSAQRDKEKFEFNKNKNISKSYSASGNKLSIDNTFGDVRFIAWDKNEIKVDVKIETGANKEDLAQDILDAISVTDKQQGNEISFKTKVENRKNHCKDCRSTMHIDFEVHLPVNVTLDVANSFGKIDLPDYNGALSVSNKFGDLTAGSLSNIKEIGVEFGSATIKNLANIEATFKFSKIDIGNLSGKNKIRLEFCDVTKISLDNGLQSLDLHESYSTVNIKPGGLSASYNISTSFGSVVDRSNIGIKRTDTPDRYGPDSDRTYEGKSGTGSARIEITSSFGKIIVGEPTEDDLKDSKDKTKNRDRSRSRQVI
jgi:hypothetical protein